MKKILILTVIFTLLITSYGFAQMKLGLFGGYNLYMEDVGDEGTAGGVAFGAKLGYGLGDTLSIGLITGYLQMYSYSMGSVDVGMTSIPILAFGQASFSGIYVLGGMGLHLVSVTLGPLTASTSEIGATIGAGYEMDLGGAGLEVGGLFHMIFTEEMSKMITIHVGVNFGI